MSQPSPSVQTEAAGELILRKSFLSHWELCVVHVLLRMYSVLVEMSATVLATYVCVCVCVCVCGLCSAPDLPPRGCVVLEVSSTSFGVAWNSPDPPNGDIANYTIVYRPVEAVADYDPSTLEGSTTSYTGADTTMLMAVDLQSAVLYSIQLAATNQIGTSPFSQDLKCTVLTLDDGEWWLPI